MKTGGGEANLFIIMETIRENRRHMTTSKLKPYQRRLEEGREGGREERRGDKG